eukprot:547130-Prorocentrum_minimum.AAC.1
MHEPSMSPSSKRYLSTAGVPPILWTSSITYLPEGFRSAMKGTLSEHFCQKRETGNAVVAAETPSAVDPSRQTDRNPKSASERMARSPSLLPTWRFVLFVYNGGSQRTKAYSIWVHDRSCNTLRPVSRVLSPCSSPRPTWKSSRVSSMPAESAMAIRWSTALVEPPSAITVTIAFSNAARV